MAATLSNSSTGQDDKGIPTITDTYLVSGHTSVSSAQSDAQLPQWGMSHPTDPYLVCTSTNCSFYGGQTNTTTFVATRTYTRKTSGSRTPEPANPALKPTIWTRNVSLTSEQFDTDIDGNPIVASNRQRFNQPFSKLIADVTFTGTKVVMGSQMATKLAQIEEFAGCVNDAQWKGRAKGTVMFLGASVGGIPEFPQANESFEIPYGFSYRKDGYQTIRIKDDGYLVYNRNYAPSSQTYDQTKQKYILPGTTSSPTQLIALNGKGSPFVAPAGTPNPEGEGVLPYAELETTPYACFLKYKIYQTKNFNALGL